MNSSTSFMIYLFTGYSYRPRTYVRPEVMFSQVCVCSGGRYPVSIKGKFFDTRFGLIHVQAGEKIFVEGTPPPVKGKIFDTRFGLIHVQTGKKNFVEGTPPCSKGKIFWHQIWFDTCSDWEKNFYVKGPPVSPPPLPPLPPGIARNCYGYAAGSMPLAFMQEDFLVQSMFLLIILLHILPFPFSSKYNKDASWLHAELFFVLVSMWLPQQHMVSIWTPHGIHVETMWCPVETT